MPFNDEHVARAIRASRAPVISGVGHETDFTIADFAADVRAPTPSAAAEIAVPDHEELRAITAAHLSHSTQLIRDRLTRGCRELEAQAERLERVSPLNRINAARQGVDELLERAHTRFRYQLALWHERLGGVRARLESLSPLATLDRGYALVQHRETGQLVVRVAQVRPRDQLGVRVSDGEFGAKVQ